MAALQRLWSGLLMYRTPIGASRRAWLGYVRWVTPFRMLSSSEQFGASNAKIQPFGHLLTTIERAVSAERESDAAASGTVVSIPIRSKLHAKRAPAPMHRARRTMAVDARRVGRW